MSEQIQYPSTSLTESAGTVLFHLPSRTICLLSQTKKPGYSELLLPKGRRNVDESRAAASLRETTEETTYKCSLLPVTLPSRQTLQEEDEDAGDKVRAHENCTESFYMQLRKIGREKDRAKIIWWFVAQVDEEDYEKKKVEGWDGVVKKGLSVEWLGYDDTIAELSYETDVDVVKAAIELVKGVDKVT
ncbi:hypothetical protein TWF694_000519 [Orbilia ellipsospora]|uniref:Nudix hydrolase domain-containing protein n=1 Tax=Orbilia ellipsospora TaxID=2528407 RepID=A0AAV9XS69_9PEZI